MDRKTLVDNFRINIERTRDEMGYTQPQMAKALRISYSGYKKLISGETQKIDMYLLYQIYHLTGIHPFEICGDDLDPQLTVAKKLRHLSNGQLSFIDAIADFELSFNPEGAESKEDYISVIVPTGNFCDGMLWDSASIEKKEVSKYRKRYGTDLTCGIKVTSNHLHPVYHMGDILLVCKKPPRDGDTGIFIDRETGRAYIRKFHQTSPTRLEPLIDYGEVITVDSTNLDEMNRWIKFGYILSKIRD